VAVPPRVREGGEEGLPCCRYPRLGAALLRGAGMCGVAGEAIASGVLHKIEIPPPNQGGARGAGLEVLLEEGLLGGWVGGGEVHAGELEGVAPPANAEGDEAAVGGADGVRDGELAGG
jgi:hypothetical protein